MCRATLLLVAFLCLVLSVLPASAQSTNMLVEPSYEAATGWTLINSGSQILNCTDNPGRCRTGNGFFSTGLSTGGAYQSHTLNSGSAYKLGIYYKSINDTSTAFIQVFNSSGSSLLREKSCSPSYVTEWTFCTIHFAPSASNTYRVQFSGSNIDFDDASLVQSMTLTYTYLSASSVRVDWTDTDFTSSTRYEASWQLINPGATGYEVVTGVQTYTINGVDFCGRTAKFAVENYTTGLKPETAYIAMPACPTPTSTPTPTNTPEPTPTNTPEPTPTNTPEPTLTSTPDLPTPTPEPTVLLVTPTTIPTSTPVPVTNEAVLLEIRDGQTQLYKWQFFSGVLGLGLLMLLFMRFR